MKYKERLTQWVADGASLILDNPTTAEEARQQVTAQFKKACIKLAELEDKIERGELVDRNEYLDRLMAAKDISGMTDKEIEFFAKHNARVRENADAEIVRLTAEVAELRARLDKAIEPPCKAGDKKYCLNYSKTMVLEETIYGLDISCDRGEVFVKNVITQNQFGAAECFTIFGWQSMWDTYDEAEARLKELHGGEI